MARMFGLFDYGKPGPGISKNAPKKKPFFYFWELYFRKFWKLIVANLLYVVVSLPVVTVGLAQAGLTFITRNYCREKHAFLPADFFDTIKKNWKQALITGILEVVIGAILVFDVYFFWRNMQASETASFMAILMFAMSLFLSLIFYFARYYVYLQMITFRLSLKQLYKNSLLFALGGLGRNILLSLGLGLLYALVIFVVLLFPQIMLPIGILLYVFILPAFRSFLVQFTVFPLVKKGVIDPYYKEHPDEDMDARHSLNLENTPSPKHEDAIFVDRGETAVTKEESVVPRQYNADEMRRAKRLSAHDDEDDGTI